MGKVTKSPQSKTSREWIRRGYYLFHPTKDKFRLDWTQSLSIVAGTLGMLPFYSLRPYVRGCLLDDGCGVRPFSVIFKNQVEEYIGIDVLEDWDTGRDIDIYADGCQLPFPEKAFDTVLSASVIEHVADTEAYMGEIARVLKPGGHLLLLAPFTYPVHAPVRDYYRFTANGLRALAEKYGFEVVTIRSCGGPICFMVDFFIKGAEFFLLFLDRSFNWKLAQNRVLRWFLAVPQWIFLALYKPIYRWMLREEPKEELQGSRADRIRWLYRKHTDTYSMCYVMVGRRR